MSAEFEHAPVMRDEIVDTFRSVPAGVVLDATLGAAGTPRRSSTPAPTCGCWASTAIPTRWRPPPHASTASVTG